MARSPPLRATLLKLTRTELVEIFHACFLGTGLDAEKARAVAVAAAREVARAYGGHRIYIPLPDDARNARDRQIRAARGEGASVRDLARRFRLGKSQVHAILRRDPSALLP